MYLKKQSAEYIRVLNMSVTEQLSRQRPIQNTVKHLRWSVLQKEQCLSAGAQPEIFQDSGVGVFEELGHFNKHFIKNTRKRGPVGKHFGDFSPRYS